MSTFRTFPEDTHTELEATAEEVAKLSPVFSLTDPWCVVGTILLWSVREIVKLRHQTESLERTSSLLMHEVRYLRQKGRAS